MLPTERVGNLLDVWRSLESVREFLRVLRFVVAITVEKGGLLGPFVGNDSKLFRVRSNQQ